MGWVSFLLFLLLVESFPIELLGSTDGWVFETVGRWPGLRGGQRLLVLLWFLGVSLGGAEVPQESGRWGARLGQLLALSCSRLLEEDGWSCGLGREFVAAARAQPRAVSSAVGTFVRAASYKEGSH